MFDVLKDVAFVWQHCIDLFSTCIFWHTYTYVHYSFWLVVIAPVTCSMFWMTFCSSCLLPLKKRSWHCWQMRGSFVQTSIIRLYGAFCKHHGHRTILCVNWRQLLAQKHYEKKEVSLQARIGFSQNWWCPNQLDFQFFTIAVLLLQPFCHLRVARQRRSCFRGSQSWSHK